MDDKKKSEKFAYISLVLMIVSAILFACSAFFQSVFFIIAIPIYLTGLWLSIYAFVTYKCTPTSVMFILYMVFTGILILTIIGYLIFISVIVASGCSGCYDTVMGCPG